VKQHDGRNEHTENEVAGRLNKSPTVRRDQGQYNALSHDQLRRIGRLAVVLDEAYLMTMDGWVDGFCRDAHPEREIALFEAVAVVYAKLADRSALDATGKQSLCATIVGATLAVDVAELQGRLPDDLAETVGIEDIRKLLDDAVRNQERP
jgi:hypothetical protein